MDISKTVKESRLVIADRLALQCTRPQSNEAHLSAAMNWLKYAQDMTDDAGVAQTYLLRYGKWANSYPETTGYIIPTFYRYHAMCNDEEYRSRAIAMADWECEIQLENGGVLAGALGDSADPTIFNTGQVLFGWAKAFEQEGDERYRESAHKAATWLCDVMDADGCWRQFGSPFTTKNINLYNTRSAWGLCRVHQITGEARFRDLAIANAEWALEHCRENGWAEHNCLQDDSQPFLHTIAYAMRGFLEIGIYCDRQDFVAQAIRMGDAVLNQLRPNGNLPGRYDSAWLPTVKWSCLTGNAQIAINWGRLYQITGGERYKAAMSPVMEYTKRTQKLTGEIATLGGIKGSHPVNGGYHPWQYPNWAAKFFADALMMAGTLTDGKGPYQDWPR